MKSAGFRILEPSVFFPPCRTSSWTVAELILSFELSYSLVSAMSGEYNRGLLFQQKKFYGLYISMNRPRFL